MALNLNGSPTIILIQGAQAPLILFFPMNLNGPPTIILFLGGPGSLNLMFANQFKRITRVKLKVFILKVANSGPFILKVANK